MRYFPLLLLLLSALSACSNHAVLPRYPEWSPSTYHRQAAADAPLVRATNYLTSGRRALSGVYPVTSAHNALAVRLATIRAARSSIDIQYFIFRRDETGLLLTRELIRAADRGVRVRFLLDDFTTGSADRVLLALGRHPNIQIRLFNPFPHKSLRALEFFIDFCRLHRRMHNKSFTVDNRVSFIGGRNLSNKYFGIDREINFGDLDMLTIGAVVPDISQQFDAYWNSPYSFPVDRVIQPAPDELELDKFNGELEQNAQTLLASDYGISLDQSPVIATLSRDPDLWYWGDVRALFDPPHKIRSAEALNQQFAGGELMKAITSAERELVIISPYLLPGREYLPQLINAANRGVKISILTNTLASTDVVLVHGAYRKYREPLLRAGVELYEMSSELKYKLDNWNGDARSLLHAKAFVIDRERVYVGSFNLDPRSILLNTELGLMIESKKLATEIADNFRINVPANAYRLEWQREEIIWYRADGSAAAREPGANLLQRIGSLISSWLPLEHLL